jgi:hypothetical protein
MSVVLYQPPRCNIAKALNLRQQIKLLFVFNKNLMSKIKYDDRSREFVLFAGIHLTVSLLRFLHVSSCSFNLPHKREEL